jgi:hypothetical protein
MPQFALLEPPPEPLPSPAKLELTQSPQPAPSLPPLSCPPPPPSLPLSAPYTPSPPLEPPPESVTPTPTSPSPPSPLRKSQNNSTASARATRISDAKQQPSCMLASSPISSHVQTSLPFYIAIRPSLRVSNRCLNRRPSQPALTPTSTIAFVR